MSDESAVLQTGVGAIFLAYYAYRLTKRQRDDAWFHAFTSLHESFWNDDDLKYVRACRVRGSWNEQATRLPRPLRITESWIVDSNSWTLIRRRSKDRAVRPHVCERRSARSLS